MTNYYLCSKWNQDDIIGLADIVVIDISNNFFQLSLDPLGYFWQMEMCPIYH